MISYIVCASTKQDAWHRKIKYIRAHSASDISQSERLLKNKWWEDTDTIIRVFPIDPKTPESQLPTPGEMWEEGLNEKELQEYLDA